jgi:putative transcriptional regulator
LEHSGSAALVSAPFGSRSDLLTQLEKESRDMAKSFRGQVLVAAKHLRDANFYKSVVLLVEHHAQGAMGLVLNRPSTILVSHALPNHFGLEDCVDLVYCGGPVEPPALMVLHSSTDLAEDERPIVPDVYIGSSETAFREAVRQANLPQAAVRCRVYSGYSGWGPGQLEDEIKRGDWYLTPGSAESVFHDDPYEVYELLLKEVGTALGLPVDPATHTEWN